MGAYRKFVLMPSVSEVLSSDDAARVIARGVDEGMNDAEYALQDRPCALRQARQLYRDACLRLYLLAKDVTR
jgi:hypothetical protein